MTCFGSLAARAEGSAPAPHGCGTSAVRATLRPPISLLEEALNQKVQGTSWQTYRGRRQQQVLGRFLMVSTPSHCHVNVTCQHCAGPAKNGHACAVFACADTRSGRGRRERLGPGATRPQQQRERSGKRNEERSLKSRPLSMLQKVWLCTPCIILHHFASTRSCNCTSALRRQWLLATSLSVLATQIKSCLSPDDPVPVLAGRVGLL